jgi:DNA-directed RNA polymerase subunit RPC12/RpoP
MKGPYSSYPPAEIHVRAEGQETFVEIVGVVNEDTKLELLPSELAGTNVVFDLKGLRRFNSPGVQRWRSMIRELSEKTKKIIYVNVHEPFLIHCSIIAGFKGTGMMGSVQVEYVCERCHREHAVTLLRERDFPQGHIIPRTGEPCETCGAKTFLDDLALPEVL